MPAANQGTVLFNMTLRVSPAQDIARARRRRGLLAIAVLGLAYALMMQPLGWAQTSHYALVRALSNGTPEIDAYHWETRDKAWYDGHYYAVKGPGLALFTLPLYSALHAVGGDEASAWAARQARANAAGRWSAAGRPNGLYGHSIDARDARPRRRRERDRHGVGARAARRRAARGAVAAARAVAGRAPRTGTRHAGGGHRRRGNARVAIRDHVLLAPARRRARVRRVRAAVARARGAAADRPGRARRAARGLCGHDRVSARDRGRDRRALRARARERRPARTRVCGRRAGGRAAAGGLQPLGVRVPHPQLLQGRGVGPGHLRARGARPQRTRVLRDRHALVPLAAPAALRTSRPVGGVPGTGARGGGHGADVSPRQAGGGAHDRRDHARVPALQRRLLASLRWRLGGTAVPDPDPAVPGGPAGARVPAIPGGDACARGAVGRADARRDHDAAADRVRLDGLLGARARRRHLRAHRRDHPRRGQRLGRARPVPPRDRRRDRARGVGRRPPLAGGGHAAGRARAGGLGRRRDSSPRTCSARTTRASTRPSGTR